MRPLAMALASCALVLVPTRTWADEDEDLGRIPGEALKDEPRKESPAESGGTTGGGELQRRLFLEGAFTASPFTRPVPVPSPKRLVSGYENRASFDGTLSWSPVKLLRFALSDRLSVLQGDGVSLLSSRTVRNDLREAFLSAEVHENTFLELGRVNVRSGVALGFNPTDFFRTRTLVGQSSLDPSVIRENRLGTLMVRLEAILDSGALSLAFAPKVQTSPPVSERRPLGVDPHLGATNGMNRALATLSLHVLDLSPQLLGYLEPHRAKVGLNVSRPVGSAIVAYGEWAGGREPNLATRAHAFGVATGTLPPDAPVLPPTTTASAFRNDLATGFSLTVARAATLNFEYLLHEGGFGGKDLRRWLSIGSQEGAPPFVNEELWYVRGYASDEEEPLARHQLFLRAEFPKTLRHDLDLSAFAFVNPEDGSSLAQLSLRYFLSDAWTLSAFLSANLGASRSERGSYPESVSAIVELRLYL